MAEQYSDKELVEGCMRNERIWQERLYRRFYPTMLRMCQRYTDDQEVAMEMINNGFLRVFQKIQLFGFTGSLEGWIRRVVFHSISDYFRRKDKPVYFLDVEERDAPTRETALSSLYLEDILHLVEALPGATKEVFWLYAVEGYTHVEIAEKINISVGTSKWHLAMARQKLKHLIQNFYNNANYAR